MTLRIIHEQKTRWTTLAALLGTVLLGAFALRAHAAGDSTTPERAATLLSANCLKCHDSVKKTAGIDLTSRAAASASGVLNERDPAHGRLLLAVAEGRMPPTGKLQDADIGVIRQWILAGAVYPREKLTAINPAMLPLWSFQPVRQPRLPHTRFDALARNPVDRFIFDRLAQSGLAPSPPASRLELLRRVTIDLTGLPPTPTEIAFFLADRSPNAYEKVVDRLLASPAYGERWGRHWLDVVRYGESDGYERNLLRPNAWPYRDYVISAFNRDLPYPQFVAEQLAGDVLGQGDPNVEAATGFLVAGVHDIVGNATEEGTRQQRINDLEDITATTGAAFLGLTVGCARCHDHKFDPIPQRDFYRLAAVFAGVRFGERPIISGLALERQRQQQADLAHREFTAINGLNELDDQARQIVLQQKGGSATRPAVNARRNVDNFASETARFVRFTVLATRDGMEPCIDELQVYGPDSSDDLALESKGAKATASDLLPGFDIHQIAHLNDGRFGNDYSWISKTRGGGWAQIELPSAQRVNRVVWSRDGAEIPRFDDRLPVRYRIDVSEDGHTWRTVSTEAGRATTNDYVHPDRLVSVMTPSQRAQREAFVAKLQDLQRQRDILDAWQTAYAGQFTAPDPMFVLRRGDVMQRGDPVTPGALSQVTLLSSDLTHAPNEPEPQRRLALAHWIGDPKNPLTARVWQYHFGRGIVGTPSDFGRNGEKPSHPELLDWLANDFMAHGWRLKRLHKMIVTSYAYCQLSANNPKGLKADAGNRLIWHMPLQRMDAEAVRDAILATSGKLDRRMGGPSFPLFKYNVVNVAIYEPMTQYGPETWRRSVYQQAARAIHDDLLGAFDCPESSQRAPKRESTTTALQALSLLNGPFLLQQSGFFAQRVQHEAGQKPEACVVRAFLIAFGRTPDTLEKRAALRLVSDQGLTSLCRALMNANEFLYY